MGERLLDTQEVASSILASPTSEKQAFRVMLLATGGLFYCQNKKILYQAVFDTIPEGNL